VLDIGCGEGKDAVFLAKNGYRVTAFDVAENGIEKARELAKHNHVEVDFFVANMHEYKIDAEYDIIFSSGVLHYLPLNKRKEFLDELRCHTTQGGIHVVNAFVRKPFIEPAPDMEEAEKKVEPWLSGELAGYYHDWFFHQNEEIIFDCNSSGVPHVHCMDILIAEKK